MEGHIAYDSYGESHAELLGDPIWRPTNGMIDGVLWFDGPDDLVGTEYILNPTEG